MPNSDLVPMTHHSLEPIFHRVISDLREDMINNPYLAKALLVTGGRRVSLEAQGRLTCTDAGTTAAPSGRRLEQR